MERFDVLVGMVELVVDVVVLDMVLDVVFVIVILFEVNMIFVVYVDFEILFMVVMNVFVKFGFYGLGVYRLVVFVCMLVFVCVLVFVWFGRLVVLLMSWCLCIGSDVLFIFLDCFFRMKL